MKLFKNALSYEGGRCDVIYEQVNNFEDLPDDLKVKAHGVCFCDGRLLLVNHPDWNVWGIPGGTRNGGESIEETLKREILEETNCTVIDHKPIGYLKVVSPDGGFHFRLQYICNVRPLGEFKKDTAGNIDKILWISPNDFEKYIEDREYKKIIISEGIREYNNI